MASVIQGFDAYIDDLPKDSGAIYNFTRKNQLSTKNNPLCGICLPQWMEILRTRYHQIEWTIYWPRLLVISILACVNSLLSIPEQLIYGQRIENTKVDPRPVFILGHPRTGTTLLHSLLALDTNQFSVCTTFCAGFPSCFLWFESIGKLLFRGVMDKTRPMDNVKLDFDLPQEDELATNVLSAGTSPYMPLFFMKQEPSFRAYYAFDLTSPEGSDQADPGLAEARKRWIGCFMYLAKKLTLRGELRNSSGQQRLLLKSPVHTARIPLLLSLFPEAQFIYIHRHPCDVFRSAAHMADTTYWYTYMNTPSNGAIQEFILRQYEILWDRFREGRALLRNDQLLEVSFNELSSDPVGAVERIYKHFQWDGWNNMAVKLQEELRGVQLYQQNQHASLTPELNEIVRKRWKSSFQCLGYD